MNEIVKEKKKQKIKRGKIVKGTSKTNTLKVDGNKSRKLYDISVLKWPALFLFSFSFYIYI